VVGHPMDRFLTYALQQLIRARANVWRPAWEAGTLTWGNNPAQQRFVLDTVRIPEKEPVGVVLYRQFCGNCHQPEGRGLPGVYPPLKGTDWVSGDSESLIKMVMHGVQGPMRVGDRVYNLPMPPSGFNDQQVADVLTYIRSSWGNAAPPVSLEDVVRVRQVHGDRTRPWSVQDLVAPTQTETPQPGRANPSTRTNEERR
jgi:mono/diheme cytochrome c family protein